MLEVPSCQNQKMIPSSIYSGYARIRAYNCGCPDPGPWSEETYTICVLLYVHYCMCITICTLLCYTKGPWSEETEFVPEKDTEALAKIQAYIIHHVQHTSRAAYITCSIHHVHGVSVRRGFVERTRETCRVRTRSKGSRPKGAWRWCRRKVVCCM